MSLLFHLYDSDNEGDDDEDGDEARPDTVQMALMRYLLFAGNVVRSSAWLHALVFECILSFLRTNAQESQYLQITARILLQ